MDQPGQGPQGTTTPQRNSIIHMTTFFWGKQVEILFPGFPDQNLGLYVLSLFFVAVLAATVEVLKVTTDAGKQQRRENNPRKTWLIQSGVHMLRVGLTYMVMLSVMSYNAGIFLAAVAGHTLGFFVSTRPVASLVQPDLIKEMNLSSTKSSSMEA
ncbi:copper transporter 6-like [Macadamia integrifolia]|uniref:copper transporter 6-like n=1 Tax=Macadamia integrifolia TaxID=60698 RepID=UPI001C4F59C4|nr:copper transporter 6-like [Macadamia integrifolia]